VRVELIADLRQPQSLLLDLGERARAEDTESLAHPVEQADLGSQAPLRRHAEASSESTKASKPLPFASACFRSSSEMK
jgi:hypothetical protein